MSADQSKVFTGVGSIDGLTYTFSFGPGTLIVSKDDKNKKSALVSKCDRVDVSTITFSTDTINYKNSPFYLIQMKNPANNSFGLKNIPTSYIRFKNGNLVISFDNNRLSSKFKRYIEKLQEMDQLLLKSKSTLFEQLKNKGLVTHPDLYIHTPLVHVTKNRTYVTISLSKTKDSKLLTNFTKNKVVTSISKDYIDPAVGVEKYMDYKYAYVVFKVMAKFSKSGDNGVRTFSLKLIASDVHLGEEARVSKNRVDDNNSEIVSVEI